MRRERRSHGSWRLLRCRRCREPGTYINDADPLVVLCSECPHTDLPDRAPTAPELAFLCRLRTYGGSQTDRGHAREVVDACVSQDWCRVVSAGAVPSGPRLLELSPTGRRLPGVVPARKPRKGRAPRE